MFWHITALKFRNSLVWKFIFDLSPFYVEELAGENKHSSLPWLACYGSLKNVSPRPFARTMLSPKRRKSLLPLQNAAIQVSLSAFIKSLSFITLWIQLTLVELHQLITWREGTTWLLVVAGITKFPHVLTPQNQPGEL